MPCLTVEWSHRVGSKLFPHSASLKSTIHAPQGPWSQMPEDNAPSIYLTDDSIAI